MAAKLTGNFQQDMQNAQHLMDRGRFGEAESLLGKIAKKAPKDPDVHNFLGLVFQHQNKLPKAKIHFQKAIKLAPRSAGLLVNMGLLLKAEGKLTKAEETYRKALSLSPDLIMIYINLGMVLSAQGRLDEAIGIYRQGLEKEPQSLDLLVNFAETLADSGDNDGAASKFEEALTIAPGHVSALVGYGTLLKNLKRFAESEKQFQKALTLAPGSPEVRNNYGVMLSAAGRISEAEIQMAEVVRLAPDILKMRLNHIAAVKDLGQTDRAARLYEGVLQAGRGNHETISNFSLTLNYSETLNAAEIAAKHIQWSKSIGGKEKGKKGSSVHRRLEADGSFLRIGYVSPDFRRHSVANFIKPVIRGHDREAFEVFCYSMVKTQDEETEQLKKLSDHWRDCADLSTSELKKQIVGDGIDVLIDLAGHTGRNRLDVFADRAAPLQITWIGYPNTTGLEAMDVRLVDALTDPDEPVFELGTERLVRLPGCFLCYEPIIALPPVAPPPYKKNGFITFGCFNNLAKIQDGALSTWTSLLKRVPESRLLLKGRYFGDEGVQKRFRQVMSEAGVEAERLVFKSYAESQEDHLAIYNEVDIALDTFPYNGTTTTCEAMIMGVPVVTLVGDRHAARVGFSLLSAVGLEELAAENPEAYVACAAVLATDRDRLAELRSGLRQRMQASPLMDAKSFVARYEEILKALFKERQEA